MKVRIKFKKQGTMRFIGHLDVMRFFQKLSRRAKLDVKYTEGFNPHQVMSLSTPLGLGDTSDAEYMDVEFITLPSKNELIHRMNAVNVEELEVLDARILPDDAKNCMSILAAADYRLIFREQYKPENIDAFFDKFFEFFNQDEIVVLKETKKSKKMVDIKPQVHFVRREGDEFFMQVDCGSESNLKPELLLKAFYEKEGLEFTDLTVMLNREEQYGLSEDGKLIKLLDFGEDFA